MHASNSKPWSEMMIDAPVLSQKGYRKTARMKKNKKEPGADLVFLP